VAHGSTLGAGFLSALLLSGMLRAQTGAEETAPAATSLTRARARVVVVEAPGAMDAFTPRPALIRRAFETGLTNLARAGAVAAAWEVFVKREDVVGVKVHCGPGPLSGTRPSVVEALVQSLLDTGHPADRIIIWDKHEEDLRRSGFLALGRRLGVSVQGAVEAGYDPHAFYDNALPGRLVWGDLEFRPGGNLMGRRSYVTRLLTRRITRVINVTPLLNHNLLGVSGCLFTLAYGSVDNTQRFAGNLDRLAVAVPEIYALPEVGDHVAFHLVDALVAQYAGEESSLLHYSAILNQLRFSTDPVALDVLSIQELARQRRRAGVPAEDVSLAPYHNASLLELGVSQPRAITLEKVRLKPGSRETTRSAASAAARESRPAPPPARQKR